MTSDTINDAVTMQTGAEGALLANRYRVVRQLGQGGMGSVWLAEDTQLDNKQFAIKMLPSILVSNKRAYRQLKDEALVAMQLVHPNIVQIRAFEENNGNPFLVMDYVDGETLDDYLAEKGGGNLTQSRREAESQRNLEDGCLGYGIPEADVIRILKPIAAALDYAHGEGVVHRDVKPANVMIRKDGHPFILDFGIAREIQETMTRVTGKLSSGTLLYMSPEQLNGDPPKPTQDVYSFAAMVYECLKGEPPFSRGQIEHQILNNPPQPLAGASVPLARSVMSGLAKKPGDRPSTCAAVLTGGVFQRRVAVPRRDVVPINLSGRVVPSASHARRAEPSAVAEIRTPRKLKDVALPVACIVVALSVIGGVLWYRATQRTEAARNRAVELRQAEETRRQSEAEQERRRAEEVARMQSQIERLAREKAETERKAREAEALRLATERELARQKEEEKQRQIEEKSERERQERILASVKAEVEKALKRCGDAHRAAIEAGAEEFAENELSVADEQFKKIRGRHVSTEDGKDDFLMAANAVMRAYNGVLNAAVENARPCIYLKATLNGVEKNAKITEGVVDSGLNTPMSVDAGDMPIGSTGKFAVEYSENGILYEGRIEYTVKKGRQVVEALLMPKYTLPAGIRHCRHCGLSLAGYSRNINICPKCRRSLFR